jgi:hypothetical protein
MNHGQEKRRSFRIREAAYVKFDVLDQRQFDAGLDHRRIALGQDDSAQAAIIDIDARLSEASHLLGPNLDHVSRCIMLLNDKLNVVIEQLPGLRETKAALVKSRPLNCEISADGMVFPVMKPLEAGTKLHLRFLLTSDSRYVETFCHVVRPVAVPAGNDADKFPYAVAVEFVGMKSAQREILIQHMFNRESESLRIRRLNLDAME